MKSTLEITIHRETTVREAMGILDRTGLTILLLVDGSGRFLRTVTDGDLRRLIMRGAGLDCNLTELPLLNSATLAQDDPGAALAMMNKLQIDQIPVVDEERRPVGLFLRRDLDAQILLSTPHMGEEERDFVESAFQSNWIAPLGPNVEAFERELAAHVGIGHAAALSSGTAAIHLALRLLAVGPGDIVFCTSLTFIATANPILYAGATPVFIDSEPETWNMSPVALAIALADAERRHCLPKAAIVVSLYGQSADMDPLLALCGRYDIPIIEDAAESLGATYRGKASGTIGRIGIYSFNGNKIITTSGGGMIVSAEQGLIEQARFLATQARDAVPSPYYHHTQLGYNYRLSNVLAGIGRGQLRVLDDRVTTRRAIFERYREGLADVSAISWMPEASFGRATRWLSVCLLDPAATGLTPAAFIRRLADEKIEARHVWKPLHLQPLFQNCAYFSHTPGASVADQLFARGVCLPSGSNLTRGQQERIIRAVRTTIGISAPVAKSLS